MLDAAEQPSACRNVSVVAVQAAADPTHDHGTEVRDDVDPAAGEVASSCAAAGRRWLCSLPCQGCSARIVSGVT